MIYRQLGETDLHVSVITFGAWAAGGWMWGGTDRKEAIQAIRASYDLGVTSIDTAPVYGQGTSEEIVREAIQGIPRDKVQILTKFGMRWDMNPPKGDFSIRTEDKQGNVVETYRYAGKESIMKEIENSLRRLGTDYIDLYQLHWPNRTSPHFGKHHPGQIRFSEVDAQAHSAGMLEILQALDECVKQGRIRHFGLSDDTPWGINEYIRLSERHGLTRVTSIQNEFNLLHTKDWPFLIENCVHTEVAYLPWSPLASGVLSGKYIDGARPAGSRWSIGTRQGLFRDTVATNEAVKAYAELAGRHDLTPAQLSLAWVDQVDGVTSTIIGANTREQLEEILPAADVILPPEILARIDEITARYPYPLG